MRRTATILLALLAGLFAVPAPATAGTANDVTVDVFDDVMYPGCSSYTFAVDLDLPAAAEGWYLDIKVRGPGGAVLHEDYLSDSAVREYLDHMWICSEDTRPGTFTIKGTGAWYDADYRDRETISIDQSFALRRPRSVTTLQAVNANPRPDTWAKLKTLVVAETRRGLDASKFTAVVLQRLKAGRWVLVKGSRVVTDKFGEAAFRYRYRGGRVSLRAKATPAEISPSTSLRVVLR